MTEKKENQTKALNNAQKKHLRKLGHSITPVVYIGKEGLGETVVEAINEALNSRELIKVKLIKTDKISKHEAAEIVPVKTSSALVQLIGKTLLLYRRNPDKKKDEQIKLP